MANRSLPNVGEVANTFFPKLAAVLVGVAGLIATAAVGGVASPETREKLLADLEEKRRLVLADLEVRFKKREAALAALQKEEAVLRKHPRFGDPFNKQVVAQFNALQKKQRTIAAEIRKAREELARKSADFEQEKRSLLVKYPASGDPKFIEHKGRLFTQEELDRWRAYEETHGDPKKVADAYLKTLTAKGLLSRPTFSGFYRNPKRADSYAAAYKVASANGKKVLGGVVHLFVFKDGQGYWQVSAFSRDGVHVMLGPPPRDFLRVTDPK